MDRAGSADVEWAHEYDGYTRLASTPEQLEKLLRRARNSYRTHGRVPSWCGVDLLRGWAFLLVRADRHSGGCPRAVITVKDDADLDPESANSIYGARLRLWPGQTSKGGNVVQKGLSTKSADSGSSKSTATRASRIA